MNPYQTTYQSSYQPTSPSSVQLNMPASPGGTANAGPMFANLPFDASTHHTHPGANPGARSHGVPAQQLDSSIVAVQRNLSDDEALALALSKDEAQQQVQMHAPACESDRALAVALATQEEEAMQEAVAAGADLASLMYPQLAVNWGERDSILDGRLSRLPSLVLKPRINQKHWLADHVTDDRARVIARMEEYGLVERVVQGDGACQFRSLSDQLYGSPEHHKYVRDTVVKQLKAHADQYKMYAEQDFNDYLAEMSRPTTWGDHITLKAAADAYGVRIVVLTSFKENFVLAIDPQEKRSTRVLWLSFWAEVHYNSLYPQEEPPAVLSQEEPLLGAKAWDWHWLWDLLLGG